MIRGMRPSSFFVYLHEHRVQLWRQCIIPLPPLSHINYGFMNETDYFNE